MRHVASGSSLLLLASLLVSSALAFSACGSSSRGAGFGGDDASVSDASGAEGGSFAGLDTLTVSPATAELVAGDAPTTAAFTVQAKFKDGSSRDVTSLVTWQVSPPTLVTMNGAAATATGTLAGDGQVIAYADAISASAQVHVKLVKSVLAPGTPAGAPQQLTGAEDPTLAARVVYPLDGALFPPNVGPPDVQFTPAAGTSVFDVAFASASLDVHFYTPCAKVGATAGCSLVPDGKTWSAIAATLRGGDPATVTVRAAGAAAGKVGTTTLKMQLAATDVAGGLYYFNTKPQPLADGGASPPGIFRYDFDNARHEPFFTRDACAGCHALSRDGTKVLAPICTLERGCGRPLQLAVVDVATGHVDTPPFPVGDTDTLAWSPDNKYYVTTPSCAGVDPNPPHGCAGGYSGGVLTLVDATTNTAVGKVPAGAGAMYPAFSNDGNRLVYARGAKYNAPLSIESSSLFTVDFTAPTWGAEKALLTSAGENNYHPSYSPDDAWVIFARSTCDAGAPASDCDSYDDPGARVTVVPAAGGAAIDLANANGAGKLDNSWPKWSPFKGKYKDGDLLWLTFSSARDYGYRTYDAAGNATHHRQLWAVAFDPARAKAGKDPSFAPVWLPFQDTETSNHIGQWTTKVVPGPK